MAKTVKEAKADIFLRDTDSQSLFNNSGELVFKYFHEWNDCYNKDTGETAQIDGEVYNESKDSYEPNCPTGYSPVFNGRLSALWDNLSSQFSSEIEDIYKAMRTNGLSYKDMLSKYKEYWKYWCENLYNADAFGYANTNNFTKAYGDKVQVMDYFYSKRQRYLDSKYKCGSSISNTQRMRLYERGNGFAIKYYQAIYSSLQWGIGNYSTQRNIKPGTYTYMPFGFSNPQDATFDIDDADLITELSTYTKSTSGGYVIGGLEGLGNFKFDSDMSILKRLTKFIMNYTAASPNTNEQGNFFDLSGMSLLKQVIVRNVTNLKKSIILSSDMVEEIDFTGTPIAGVQTPPSDTLTKLVLPDSITELRLVGYSNLEAKNLSIAGYSNIVTLDIEDCPNLDSYTIAKACYDAGAKLSNTIIKGIDWELDNTDFLLKLASNGADLQGKIVLENVKLSITAKQAMLDAWGDIDNENNSLYIKYDIIDIVNVSVRGRDSLSNKGEYYYTLVTTPSNANNIKSVKWSISENDFAEIDNAGKVTINKVGSAENNDKATISVSVTLTDNKVLQASKEINLYKKVAEVGDLVFNDGTYGASYIDGLTPVAVIIYIEPKKRKLAVCMSLSGTTKDYNWGICKYNLPNIELGDTLNKNYDVYDIGALENVTAYYSATESNILDAANTENDGFKSYPTTSSLGAIGFVEVTDDIYNKYQEYMSDIEVGDSIPVGMLNTLAILKHRDRILADSAINLPVPKNTDTIKDLNTYISSVVSKYSSNTSYSQFYYGAASYCHLYEPAASDLDTQLTKGHWFFPAIGECSRYMWYVYNSINFDNKYSVFKRNIEAGVISSQIPTTISSSSERPITNPTSWTIGDIVTLKNYVTVVADTISGQSAAKNAYNNINPAVVIRL